MPFRCASGKFTRNEEPSLDELLAEPIVRLTMVSDGVQELEIRRLFASITAPSSDYGRLPPGSQGPHSPTD